MTQPPSPDYLYGGPNMTWDKASSRCVVAGDHTMGSLQSTGAYIRTTIYAVSQYIIEGIAFFIIYHSRRLVPLFVCYSSVAPKVQRDYRPEDKFHKNLSILLNYHFFISQSSHIESQQNRLEANHRNISDFPHNFNINLVHVLGELTIAPAILPPTLMPINALIICAPETVGARA